MQQGDTLRGRLYLDDVAMHDQRALFFALLRAPLAALAVLTLSAATYYVKTGGNDAAAGTSDATAWAHAPGMAEATGLAASTTLNPGDSVLLRRGDTWTFTSAPSGTCFAIPASGTSANRITFGAYGTGDRPKLDGNGLATWYGMLSLTSISYVTIDSWDMYGSQHQVVQVWAPSSVGVTIQNCLIHDNTLGGYEGIEIEGNGIVGGVTQITVDGCEFYNIQHDGLKLNDGVTNATISNNTFHDVGHDAVDTLSVWSPSARCSNFTIYGNDITRLTDEFGSNGPGTGMYIPGLTDSEIYGNTFHDYQGEGIQSSGQVYTARNLVVRNNVFWNLSGSGNYAIWFTAGNTGINVWNNTVYNCNCPDIDDGGESFANNLAYDCVADVNTIKNFATDPLFVNATGPTPDFHLQAGSAAIDVGVDVGLPYNGTAPDLGAYEYTAPPNAPIHLRVVSSP